MKGVGGVGGFQPPPRTLTQANEMVAEPTGSLAGVCVLLCVSVSIPSWPLTLSLLLR